MAERKGKDRTIKAWAVDSATIGLAEDDDGIMIFHTKRKASEYFFGQIGNKPPFDLRAVRVTITVHERDR